MSDVDHLDDDAAALVLRATDAEAIIRIDTVQTLWSGYGQIVRCRLAGGAVPSVIVKRVRWPEERNHPRGWASDRSHARKLRSYEVETAWYEGYADRCSDHCRVPQSLEIERQADGVVMVMEDLDAAGFDGRRQWLGADEFDACLRWLASFHATFMGAAPLELWETGTYWHLATRPDELEALDDDRLRRAAPELDRLLAESSFQTLVHGDAKVANFCFDASGGRVAAVDFQYVGGGCGMKDLAYFVGSCLDEAESEQREAEILYRYFELLRVELAAAGSDLDADALEAEWRALYPVAWTDFHRFLKGWSPGHWKLNSYSERVAREVLDALPTEHS